MNISKLYGPVYREETVIVGEQCVLGYPRETRIRDAQRGTVTAGNPVYIAAGTLVGNQVIIQEGTSIGADCVIDDQVRFGYGCVIGARSRIVHGAYLCDRITVGEDSCVDGFICDGTVVGKRSTVMGDLVHEYSRPDLGWWGPDESAPVIEDDSVIGFGAKVIGGVKVRSHSYVAAGALVSKDVPSEHVVTGVNIHTALSHWGGTRLRDLIALWTRASPRGLT